MANQYKLVNSGHPAGQQEAMGDIKELVQLEDLSANEIEQIVRLEVSQYLPIVERFRTLLVRRMS